MTDEDLQAIEERWKKATPGPWGTTYGHKRASICQVYTGEYFDHKVIYQDYDTSHFYPIKDDWQGNIQAIANAPTDVAALLAEVRRLNRMVVRIYNSGYHAGHHDTVEGQYTHILPQEMDSYQADVVEELIAEYLESEVADNG